MRQTWRWFGPKDFASVDDMMQAGVEGVVSALHHIPPGAVWTPEEIAARQAIIRPMRDGSASTLLWEVVESLPLSQDIKKHRDHWRDHIANWKANMTNPSRAGIDLIFYNFMPVLDWTRTDLAWRLPNGATCMQFDFIDYVSFDICILGRQEAAEDFPKHVGDAIARRFAEMDEAACKALSVNVAGSRIATVLPSRRSAFPLLGLSRIMSTETDYQLALDAVDLTANGVTLCTGSFGARADNDLPAMMQRLCPRAHFLHLRNVRREGSDLRGSFDVAEHLGGNTDMVGVITAIIAEERRRRTEGRTEWNIPFRPDRGQDILDFLRCKRPTAISCHRAAQRLVGIARDQDNVGSSVGHRCKSSGKSLVSIAQLRLWPTLSGPL